MKKKEMLQRLKNNRENQWTKYWFYEKINKTDKFLAELTEEKREHSSTNSNERSDIISDLKENGIKKQKYCE